MEHKQRCDRMDSDSGDESELSDCTGDARQSFWEANRYIYVTTPEGVSYSIYDAGIDVTKEDSIITLSTCANDRVQRFVVHAKRVEKQ